MDLIALCVPDVQARREFLTPHPTQICLNLVLPISYILLVFSGWDLVLRLLSLHLTKKTEAEGTSYQQQLISDSLRDGLEAMFIFSMSEGIWNAFSLF